MMTMMHDDHDCDHDHDDDHDLRHHRSFFTPDIGTPCYPGVGRHHKRGAAASGRGTFFVGSFVVAMNRVDVVDLDVDLVDVDIDVDLVDVDLVDLGQR